MKKIDYLQYEVVIKKTKENIVFHSEEPVIKYHQTTFNSCYLSSLESDLHSIGDNRAVFSHVNKIEE